MSRLEVMTRKATTCLRCEAEMAEGWLLEQVDGTAQSAEWIEGAPHDSFWPWYERKLSNRPRIPIQAYRCPKCSHVELFAPWSGPPSPNVAVRHRARKRRRSIPEVKSAQGELTMRTKQMFSRILRSSVDGVSRRTLFILDRHCRWCRDQVLKRAEPHWLDYPLVVIGLRHYYCPHCFTHCYRFK